MVSSFAFLSPVHRQYIQKLMPDSPLVQLTFSKDGGSDGVNTEVRWSYCDLCISTLWKSNLLIYVVNLYSCYSALKGLAIHMLYLGEEVS